MKLVIATGNARKLAEYRQLFAPLKIEVVSLTDINVSLNDFEETGTTFSENALLKARYIRQFTSLPVLADDSGLSVNALGGFPGIHSHRFLEFESYIVKNKAIIDLLAPYNDKTASFIAALALITNEGNEHTFIGKAPGEIMDQPRGANGFGYDPIFFSYDLQKGFAQASDDEKNRVSHRGLAFKQLYAYLLTHPLKTD